MVSFLAANQPDGFGANRDKKYPMPVKYTVGSLMLCAYLLEFLDKLVQVHGIMDSSKYQHINDQNLMASARNLGA